MLTRLILAAALLFTATAHGQDVTDLASPTPTLEFKIDYVRGLEVLGKAHGVPGLDFSAGASITRAQNPPLIHRIILDRTHNQFFGYDLFLQPEPDGTSVHLHFSALSDLRGFHFDKTSFHPAEMIMPADRTVRLSAPTDIPLETTQDGTLLLSDTLRFTRVQ